MVLSKVLVIGRPLPHGLFLLGSKGNHIFMPESCATTTLAARIRRTIPLRGVSRPLLPQKASSMT
jgi:hypothetical protein